MMDVFWGRDGEVGGSEQAAIISLWGAVAEWVERRSLNPEVLGSNPTDAVSNLGQVRLLHVALV